MGVFTKIGKHIQWNCKRLRIYGREVLIQKCYMELVSSTCQNVAGEVNCIQTE